MCPAHSDSNVDSSKIVAEINAGNKRILDSLLEGNDRFSSGNSIHPHISKERIHLLSDKQNPFVVIIACSDSRVPPEIIFDQGLGDIFVVRTAGNVIGNYELGSVEYAVEHLNCRLVIVLGHERCGAVSAYMDSNGHKHNNHIDSIIECIGSKELVKNLRGEKGEKLPAIIRANIEDDVRFLRASEPVLKELMDKNEIEIIGAIYDPLTGKAIFLEE
ncbi:MAG: hypothetical protein A2X47_06395 [Lentisphaerae bacterium GWF2_38_69]|nr:MAG: hypothetical protein A2X47_06395 [Lentisphaerae bacterium GWF2_38_69]